MSTSQLMEILRKSHLSSPEWSSQLQTELISLYKQIKAEDPTTVDLPYEDLKAVHEYVLTNRDSDVLRELLALLRNIVPFNEALRVALCRSTENTSLVQMVFESPLTPDAEPELIVTYSRLFQYFANCMTSDESTCHHFFNLLLLSPDRPLIQVVKNSREKLASVAMIVLHQVLQSDSNWSAFLQCEASVGITEVMIGKIVDETDSQAFQVLKRIAASPDFTIHFDEFPVSAQCFLLDLISEQTETTQDSVTPLPRETLNFFTAKVKKHIEHLRGKNKQHEDDVNGIIFLKLITILALSSLHMESALNNDLELLIMSIECLRTVHLLGKKNAEGLDPKVDFDSLAGNKEEIFEHPFFGLKRDLVRLIGNMCHKNKLNQDTVRDFNGIELLCDMSSLDARNPFITEWVVLALKNVMDDNGENQKIVASLTKMTETL